MSREPLSADVLELAQLVIELGKYVRGREAPHPVDPWVGTVLVRIGRAEGKARQVRGRVLEREAKWFKRRTGA